MPLPANLYLGTSSWSAPSWVGPFYPTGSVPGEFLSHYAGRFRTVEIDATFYAIPHARVVTGWDEKTPDDFVFAAKVPQVITHEKVLLDCEEEMARFAHVMSRLGPKLGVLLLQFPYFKKAVFPEAGPFLDRLAAFLPGLPEGVRFALEVRNKGWLGPPLFDLLQAHRVCLAWIDHPYMLTARQYARLPGAVTTDFLYLRWLGDRYRIEEVTKSWDRTVVDRTRELAAWKGVIEILAPQVQRVYTYVNNHYAGCAYETADTFEGLWRDPADATP